MKFTRLVTAIAKYWITKRTMVAVGEAMECLGGNGYVEESALSRLYRDAPVNSIWEGCGNVQCLDVLRAIDHDRESLEVVLHEIRAARGVSKPFDLFIDRLERELAETTDVEIRARRIVERLALALQGALLIQHAPSVVAEAFCASRLAGDQGLAFGTLPAGIDFDAIIARAMPKVKVQ